MYLLNEYLKWNIKHLGDENMLFEDTVKNPMKLIHLRDILRHHIGKKYKVNDTYGSLVLDYLGCLPQENGRGPFFEPTSKIGEVYYQLHLVELIRNITEAIDKSNFQYKEADISDPVGFGWFIDKDVNGTLWITIGTCSETSEFSYVKLDIGGKILPQVDGILSNIRTFVDEISNFNVSNPIGRERYTSFVNIVSDCAEYCQDLVFLARKLDDPNLNKMYRQFAIPLYARIKRIESDYETVSLTIHEMHTDRIWRDEV